MRSPGAERVRLKNVADILASNVDKKSVEGEVPVRLCNYTDVYYNENITSDLEFMEATASRRQVETFGLRAGDVLITKDSETADDIGIPAFVPEELGGVVCGYHLAVLRAHGTQLHPRYLFWIMASTATRQELEVSATGVTRYGLRLDAIGGVELELPPYASQRELADFLDRETGRIDDLLNRKGRLSASLYERRKSLTADAVLGGSEAVRALSGSARGRNQTEEAWLDVFPSSWHRCRLRNLVSEIKNGTWGNEPEPEGEGVVCVRAADFDRLRNRVSREKLVRRSVSAGELVKHRLDPGDLVLEKSGGGDQQPVGAAVLYDLPEVAVTTNFAARVRPAPDVDSRYLNYVLAAVYDLGLNRRSIKQTTGIQNLDTRAFFSEPWAVPPYEEQVAISDRLDRATSLLDRIMDKQERAVELFQERRQALITAAVTGEIDVPVAAA